MTGPDRALWAGLLLVTAVVGWLVAGNERLLAEGRRVLFPLAPTDPRSLMQGDYMELRWDQAPFAALESAAGGTIDWTDPAIRAWRRDPDGTLLRAGRLLIEPDAKGRPLSFRADPGAPEAALQRLAYKRTGATYTVGPTSFLFQEGHQAAFARARFGILAVAEDGTALLVGLADEAGDEILPARDDAVGETR